MFTGIISHTGIVEQITKNSLVVNVPKKIHEKLSVGDSISVNGACLTVRDKKKFSRNLEFDLMSETMEKTNLSNLKKNNKVNLELPLTPETFISGHLVAGHVNGVGRIKKRVIKSKNQEIFTLHTEKNIHKFLVKKGSIAIDGISLTIIDVFKNEFSVGIIPHTMEVTNFKEKKVGDLVNIEIDIMAKYIYNFIHTKNKK